MDRSDWFPARMKDLLGPAVGRLGIDRPVETGMVWKRWRAIVGDGIADHAEPTSLRDGVLRVRADSPTWATELTYMTPQMIDAVNETVGRKIVDSVSIWTGPSSGSRAGATSNTIPGSQTEATTEGGQADAADAEEAFSRAYRAWWKRRFGGSRKTSPERGEKAKKPR